LLGEYQEKKKEAQTAYDAQWAYLYDTYYYIWETDFWFEYDEDTQIEIAAQEEELYALQDTLNSWAAKVQMILNEQSARTKAEQDAQAAAADAQAAYDAEQKALAAEAKRLETERLAEEERQR
jgi:hypothetical protein